MHGANSRQGKHWSTHFRKCPKRILVFPVKIDDFRALLLPLDEDPVDRSSFVLKATCDRADAAQARCDIEI